MVVLFFHSWRPIAGFSVYFVHAGRMVLYFSSGGWSSDACGGVVVVEVFGRESTEHSFGPSSLSTSYTYTLACLADAVNKKCEMSNSRFTDS